MTTDPYGPPEMPRDRWGRPLVIPPGGGKPTAYTRCTTFVDALEDKYNLGRWQMRMVAEGMSQRPDLVLAAAAHRGDKDELNRICQSALDAAAAGAAAGVGTSLHKLAERLDRGLDLGVVPEAYQADIEAYRVATKPLAGVHCERFMVYDPMRIGGTPDRIVEYDGHLYIADIKTGSIEWGAGKIAMQLAVYAHSVIYDHVTGARFSDPHLNRERAIVIHLPAGEGRCELKWVDISAGWEAVQLAAHVRQWRGTKGLIYPFDPADVFREAGFSVEPVRPFSVEPVTPADHGAALGGAGLHYEIDHAPDVDTLTALWSAHRDEWTDQHTRAAKARKLALHQEALRGVRL